MYIYMYVFMYIYVYICICIHIKWQYHVRFRSMGESWASKHPVDGNEKSPMGWSHCLYGCQGNYSMVKCGKEREVN